MSKLLCLRRSLIVGKGLLGSARNLSAASLKGSKLRFDSTEYLGANGGWQNAPVNQFIKRVLQQADRKRTGHGEGLAQCAKLFLKVCDALVWGSQVVLRSVSITPRPEAA